MERDVPLAGLRRRSTHLTPPSHNIVEVWIASCFVAHTRYSIADQLKAFKWRATDVLGITSPYYVFMRWGDGERLRNIWEPQPPSPARCAPSLQTHSIKSQARRHLHSLHTNGCWLPPCAARSVKGRTNGPAYCTKKQRWHQHINESRLFCKKNTYVAITVLLAQGETSDIAERRLHQVWTTTEPHAQGRASGARGPQVCHWKRASARHHVHKPYFVLREQRCGALMKGLHRTAVAATSNRQQQQNGMNEARCTIVSAPAGKALRSPLVVARAKTGKWCLVGYDEAPISLEPVPHGLDLCTGITKTAHVLEEITINRICARYNQVSWPWHRVKRKSDPVSTIFTCRKSRINLNRSFRRYSANLQYSPVNASIFGDGRCESLLHDPKLQCARTDGWLIRFLCLDSSSTDAMVKIAWTAWLTVAHWLPVPLPTELNPKRPSTSPTSSVSSSTSTDSEGGRVPRLPLWTLRQRCDACWLTPTRPSCDAKPIRETRHLLSLSSSSSS